MLDPPAKATPADHPHLNRGIGREREGGSYPPPLYEWAGGRQAVGPILPVSGLVAGRPEDGPTLPARCGLSPAPSRG